jgi:hypothetical protein
MDENTHTSRGSDHELYHQLSERIGVVLTDLLLLCILLGFQHCCYKHVDLQSTVLKSHTVLHTVLVSYLKYKKVTLFVPVVVSVNDLSKYLSMTDVFLVEAQNS